MELKVEKLIYGGDGLARLPADEHGSGKAIFLPFVLEGERVEAAVTEEKPGFARARATKILEKSEHRVEPGCPYFFNCGGCHYQHSSYEHQLEIKASVLRENLQRIAKLQLACPLTVHPSPPWNYRNRSRMQLRTQPEFALGYLRRGSYDLLPVEECPISSPLINRSIGMLWEAGLSGRCDPRIAEIEFFTDSDDQLLLVEAYCPSITTSDEAQQVANTVKANLPLASGVTVFPSLGAIAPNSETAALAHTGASYLDYKADAASYRVSAGSFFQVNRYLVDELVKIVTRGRSGATALDLYAGVGLFSAVLSREFERVVAVESSLQAHSDLAYNVSANVKPVRASVQQYLQKGRIRADLIVVDPPRGGLGKDVAQNLAAIRTPELVYVSCDPATLARDVVPLRAGGYHVSEAHLVDLFPQTFHLETVLYLTR